MLPPLVLCWVGIPLSPKLARDEDREIRRRILSISEPEARRVGIARNEFYNLRRNVRSKRSFRLYAKALETLDDHFGSI
jgi:L-fucose isomerase-like protein